MARKTSFPAPVETDYDLIVMERRAKAAGFLTVEDACSLIGALREAWELSAAEEQRASLAEADALERLDADYRENPRCGKCDEPCTTCLPPEAEAKCDHCGETCRECQGGGGNDF